MARKKNASRSRTVTDIKHTYLLNDSTLFTDGNAFVMSMNATWTGCSNTCRCCRTSESSTNTASTVDERGRNPNCGSQKSVDFENHVQSLLNRICLYAFARSCVREMALKELALPKLPLHFHRTKFSALLHCSGVKANLQHAVSIRARTNTRFAVLNAVRSTVAVRPSGPGAEAVFMRCMAFWVSSSCASSTSRLSSLVSSPYTSC